MATKGIVGQGNMFGVSRSLANWRNFWENLEQKIVIPNVSDKAMSDGEREGRMLCVVPRSNPQVLERLVFLIESQLRHDGCCFSVDRTLERPHLDHAFESVPKVSERTEVFWIDMTSSAMEFSIQLGIKHYATIEQYMVSLAFMLAHNDMYRPDLGPLEDMKIILQGSVIRRRGDVPCSPVIRKCKTCYCLTPEVVRPVGDGIWSPMVTPVVRIGKQSAVATLGTFAAA